MAASFRAIAEPPKSRLELLLKAIAWIGISFVCIDHNSSNGYVQSMLGYDAQFTRRCSEKIEKNIVDDEVRQYLGRGYNQFSGLVNASRSHLCENRFCP